MRRAGGQAWAAAAANEPTLMDPSGGRVAQTETDDQPSDTAPAAPRWG